MQLKRDLTVVDSIKVLVLQIVTCSAPTKCKVPPAQAP